MTGKILSIHRRKMGNGAQFERVTFTLENGKWAKTDLCPTFGNYARWKPVLREGAVLGNLHFKAGSSNTINADAVPTKISFPPLPDPSQQLDLL